MSNRLLREAGEALYGSRWQTEISRDLGVSDRTIRRWASGADDMPAGAMTDLWRICLERAQALDALAQRLKMASAPE